MIEQLGCTTADATLRRILSFDSNRSCAQATESKTLSCAWRSRFCGVRYSTISLVIPNEHELASQTIGSLPPSLQRHRLSVVRFAITALPWTYPFECQIVAQQWPPISSGIHSGRPARAETAIIASCSDGLDS